MSCGDEYNRRFVRDRNAGDYTLGRFAAEWQRTPVANFPRGLRRVGLSEQQSNAELGAGSYHPFGSVLLAVVVVDRFRYAELLYGIAETVLDNGLIHDWIERAVQHNAHRVVDERH